MASIDTIYHNISKKLIRKQAREVGFGLEECRSLLMLLRNPSRHSAGM